MTNTLKLLALTLILTACDKAQIPPINKTLDYWGCWKEANGNTGVYDIILTENVTKSHIFELGKDCEPLNLGEYEAVFRNDTLIIDNGIFEFWCIINQDTLYYSVYADNASIGLFIK